jgi:hypothetical protein
MKTFEEKWTAWLDDALEGKERIEFESTLSDRSQAEAEKNDAQKLSAFLRTHLAAKPMANEEFFLHQLREEIGRESIAPATTSDARPGWWTIGRLLWAGATSLAIFFICAFFVMRSTPSVDQSQYLTQILNYKVDPTVSPNATISMFEAKGDKVTVLWVDGLQSLPSEFAAK